MLTNPLPNLVRILPATFTPLYELSVPIGFQFKLCGLDWRSADELAYLIGLLVDVGFLEVSADRFLARLNPLLKGS